MKLLVVGTLAFITASLLTAALLAGYREDQRVIMRFSGTGIAGKLDVVGGEPAGLLIDGGDGRQTRVAVNADGTFIARLAPGTYALHPVGDSRTVTIRVPGGDCVDLVLDYRIPGVAIRVPGEGWPIPALA